MPVRISLIGRRFTRLTVIADAPSRRQPCEELYSYSLCRCDCGKETEVRNAALKNGHTRSCGCLGPDLTKIREHIHGHARQDGETPTYIAWVSMRQRCFNPLRKDFKYYGGRGITVCERWLCFENFLADMGEKPAGRSIDRINNVGNYEPGNCRWATKKEQCRNRRSNVVFTFNGVTGCVAELCEKFHVPHNRVRMRLMRGWSIEDALK